MINEVIVVEGKNDKAHLLAIFPEMEIVTTNGSEISDETLSLIETLAKTHKIILFLDPDYPGERIRSKILERIPNCENAFLEKRKAIDYHKHKVGIEHAKKEDIIAALANKLTYSNNKGSLTMKDLFALGLLGEKRSSYKRKYLANMLHLGCPNGKTLLKRLNTMGMSFQKVSDVLNEKNWND